MKLKYVLALTAILTISAGSFAFAQRGTLPQGRPFQMLQQQIDDLDAALEQQIADLEAELAALAGRVDALEEHNAVQDALIGALQAASALLENRMTSAEASIEDLQAWTTIQEALLVQLDDRIANLQLQINTQGDDIDLLFDLHDAQQAAIANAHNAINLLLSQNSTQQAQINNLQIRLNSLQNAYLSTRNQLASGCPVNSSIRRVTPSGPVVCEPDSGRFLQVTQGGAVSPSLPAGAIASVTPTCPPASPQFSATAGGYTLPSSGAAVLQSRLLSPTTWVVTVRNTGLFPITFTARVTCARVVP